MQASSQTTTPPMKIASHWLVRADDSTPRRLSMVNSAAKKTFHSAGGTMGTKLAAAELHQMVQIRGFNR